MRWLGQSPEQGALPIVHTASQPATGRHFLRAQWHRPVPRQAAAGGAEGDCAGWGEGRRWR